MAKDDSGYRNYQNWLSKVSAYLQVIEPEDVVNRFRSFDSHPENACAILQALISKHDTSPSICPESVSTQSPLPASPSVESLVEIRMREYEKKQDLKQRCGSAAIGMLLGAWLMFKPFGFFAIIAGYSPAWFLIGGAVVGFFLGEFFAFVCLALLAYIGFVWLRG
ncbi:MAG: hypothetical protein KA260_03440 [Burkholderiales bacterium]|nr:hypothetical protein [Burkholderiales bacterium]